METRTCTVCGKDKPLKSFRKDSRHTSDKCSACRSRLYREKKGEEFLVKRRAYMKKRRRTTTVQSQVRRARRKLALMTALGFPKCRDCPVFDWRALSFHHRDPATKKFKISTGIRRNYAFDVVLEEAKKCDVVCLSCHAVLHNTLLEDLTPRW